MKKILILFLIVASLGFSSNYKVEVKLNVKIQKMELEQNNLEIEKTFAEMTKKEISNGIKEIDFQNLTMILSMVNRKKSINYLKRERENLLNIFLRLRQKNFKKNGCWCLWISFQK